MWANGTKATKTWWYGVILAVGGIGLVCTGDVEHGVELILSGIALAVGRDAAQKLISQGK